MSVTGRRKKWVYSDDRGLFTESSCGGLLKKQTVGSPLCLLLHSLELFSFTIVSYTKKLQIKSRQYCPD